LSVLKWLEERLDKFVAWRTGSPLDAARYGKRWTTSSDPAWKRHFEYFCESPAETGFLDAIVSELGLEPRDGKLVGSGVSIDLQVEIFRYRADFVANDWLVVEIDGATYHSSPEAVERDRERDKTLRGFGYEVLRIPANVVFKAPSDAVMRLRQAIETGRGSDVYFEAAASVREKASVSSVFTGIAGVLDKANRHITALQACQNELAPARKIYAAEKMLLEAAVEHAEIEVRTTDFRAKSPQHKELFDSSYSEFMQIFEEELSAVPEDEDEYFAEARRLIKVPQATGQNDVDEAVSRAFSLLMEERSSFFQSVWSRLNVDPRLKTHFRHFLEEKSCISCLDKIEQVIAPH